jgi:aspartokinase
VTYIEASRLIAQRMLLEGGADEAARLAWGFRTLTLREPDQNERKVLIRYLNSQRQHFASQPAEADRLLSLGERRADPKLSPRELAAWTMVASLILNLDETITKQ